LISFGDSEDRVRRKNDVKGNNHTKEEEIHPCPQKHATKRTPRETNISKTRWRGDFETAINS